MAKLESF